MDNITDSQIKAELEEIIKNIDTIMERIQTLDPTEDKSLEPEEARPAGPQWSGRDKQSNG